MASKKISKRDKNPLPDEYITIDGNEKSENQISDEVSKNAMEQGRRCITNDAPEKKKNPPSSKYVSPFLNTLDPDLNISNSDEDDSPKHSTSDKWPKDKGPKTQNKSPQKVRSRLIYGHITFDTTSDSEDSDDSDFEPNNRVFSRDNRRRLAALRSENDAQSSDSDDSIQEIPVPPKTPPPLIDIEESEDESEISSDTDKDDVIVVHDEEANLSGSNKSSVEVLDPEDINKNTNNVDQDSSVANPTEVYNSKNDVTQEIAQTQEQTPDKLEKKKCRTPKVILNDLKDFVVQDVESDIILSYGEPLHEPEKIKPRNKKLNILSKFVTREEISLSVITREFQYFLFHLSKLLVARIEMRRVKGNKIVLDVYAAEGANVIKSILVQYFERDNDEKPYLHYKFNRMGERIFRLFAVMNKEMNEITEDPMDLYNKIKELESHETDKEELLNYNKKLLIALFKDSARFKPTRKAFVKIEKWAIHQRRKILFGQYFKALFIYNAIFVPQSIRYRSMVMRDYKRQKNKANQSTNKNSSKKGKSKKCPQRQQRSKNSKKANTTKPKMDLLDCALQMFEPNRRQKNPPQSDIKVASFQNDDGKFHNRGTDNTTPKKDLLDCAVETAGPKKKSNSRKNLPDSDIKSTSTQNHDGQSLNQTELNPPITDTRNSYQNHTNQSSNVNNPPYSNQPMTDYSHNQLENQVIPPVFPPNFVQNINLVVPFQQAFGNQTCYQNAVFPQNQLLSMQQPMMYPVPQNFPPVFQQQQNPMNFSTDNPNESFFNNAHYQRQHFQEEYQRRQIISWDNQNQFTFNNTQQRGNHLSNEFQVFQRHQNPPNFAVDNPNEFAFHNSQHHRQHPQIEFQRHQASPGCDNRNQSSAKNTRHRGNKSLDDSQEFQHHQNQPNLNKNNAQDNFSPSDCHQNQKNFDNQSVRSKDRRSGKKSKASQHNQNRASFSQENSNECTHKDKGCDSNVLDDVQRSKIISQLSSTERSVEHAKNMRGREMFVKKTLKKARLLKSGRLKKQIEILNDKLVKKTWITGSEMFEFLIQLKQEQLKE